MAKSVSLDFNKMLNNVSHYFKHLTQDLLIAWVVLAIGVIAIVAGTFLL